MKQKGFIHQVRQAARANRVWMPPGARTNRNWPLCLTCGREVDSCSLENVNAHSVEIRAFCRHISKESDERVWENAKVHEAAYKVNFPFRIEGDPLADERANGLIKRAMGDFCPFDPTEVPK